MARRAARVDTNQAAIVKALRDCGAMVQSLAAVGVGCPDALVGYHGKTLLLEIKDGERFPSQRKLTSDQIDWHARWNGGPLVVVNNEAEALKAIGVNA